MVCSRKVIDNYWTFSILARRLPIRDCTGSCNDCVPRHPKLSAIDVTAKAFLERLYLVLGLSPFEARVNCPCAPTPTLLSFGPGFLSVLALVFWHFLALVFCQHTNHQVIWSSSGNEYLRVDSILDDFCLSNVISKYFSKLRFGTSQIQPELKCLENIISSFHKSLLRASSEHELFSVRSIALISTVVKSPDESWNNYKALMRVEVNAILISGSGSSVLCRRYGIPAFDPREGACWLSFENTSPQIHMDLSI